MGESKKPGTDLKKSRIEIALNQEFLGFKLKNILMGLIVVIIIPIIVSYFTFNYQYSHTGAGERKNLANGILNDLEYVNQTLSFQLSQIDDPNSPDYHKNPVVIPVNLYPTWGLYYVNKQDIAKFNPQLSAELYDFYYTILKAEDARITFNNYETLYPVNPAGNLDIQNGNRDNAKQSLWILEYSSMHECYDKKIPKLKTELQKIRDE